MLEKHFICNSQVKQHWTRTVPGLEHLALMGAKSYILNIW